VAPEEALQLELEVVTEEIPPLSSLLLLSELTPGVVELGPAMRVPPERSSSRSVIPLLRSVVFLLRVLLRLQRLLLWLLVGTLLAVLLLRMLLLLLLLRPLARTSEWLLLWRFWGWCWWWLRAEPESALLLAAPLTMCGSDG